MRQLAAFLVVAASVLLAGAVHADCGDQLFKLLAKDGEGGDEFGVSVAISGNIAIVGTLRDTDDGWAYLFDITTGEQLFKLLPDDGESGDYFGVSVAISGTTAIVGASGNNVNGRDSGSAFLFDTTTGEQIARLLPDDGAAGDRFGFPVAISGTTAIVGAIHNDDNGQDSGSVYLFDITNGEQIAKLVPNDGAEDDFFGFSVSISWTTAVVGALWDDDNGSRSGSAYLFDITTGEQLAKLLPDDGEADDWFGSSVAISGTAVVVGARQGDGNGRESGSAYVFDISDPSSPVQITKLLAGDGARGDLFGNSVATSASTVVVGAPRDDDNGFDSGSVYLFDIHTGEQTAKILAADGRGSDWFGRSVAASGTTAIVGAWWDDDNGSDSGSAYLLDLDGCQRCRESKIFADDGEEDDRFGWSAALSGSTAIVGAYFDDDNGEDSGSAYLFDTSDPTNPVQTAKLLPKDGDARDWFGWSVGISGTTAVVVAPGAREGSVYGAAYLFDTTTGEQRSKLLPDDAGEGRSFAWSAAISGTTAIVGAYRDDDNGRGSGSAYLFDVSDPAKPLQIFKLLPKDGAENHGFGTSVAISGTMAIVGTHEALQREGETGSAYLFDTTTGEQILKLLPNDRDTEDHFGSSVGISGTVAIVGAPDDNDNGLFSGSAYLFDIVTGEQLAKILPEDGSVADRFGASVAISSGVAIVGAPDFDGGFSRLGAAYLFDLRDPKNPVELAKFFPDGLGYWDRFGRSVAISGRTTVVGADTGDGKVEDTGTAYVYDLSECLPCRREPTWLCDGDVDGDGQVNPVDSGLVQAAFGSAEEQDLCNYDVDCDGQINPVDSGIVQSLFGTCEEPRDACP